MTIATQDDMPTLEEVREQIGPLLEIFGYNFFLLLRGILCREKGFEAAVRAGDLEHARLHAEKSIQVIQDAVDSAFNMQLREVWYEDRRGLLLLQVIEDVLRSARHNERHWLTRLAGDKSEKRTSQKQDPARGIVEAKAAAILDLFGQCSGGLRVVGDRIAKVLCAEGFAQKRSGSVSYVTIKEWRAKLNACSPDRPPSKRNRIFDRKAEARYYFYLQAKQDLLSLEMDLNQALSELARCCKRLVPRMLASGPPTGGN